MYALSIVFHSVRLSAMALRYYIASRMRRHKNHRIAPVPTLPAASPPSYLITTTSRIYILDSYL